MTLTRIIAFCLFFAGAVDTANAGANDPIRQAMEESKTTQRGLTFYVNGSSIPGVVVSYDDNFVVARSSAQGSIAIRMDKIDAVAGHLGVPERKGQ